MPALSPLSADEARARLSDIVAADPAELDKSALLAVHDALRCLSGTVDDEPTDLLVRAADVAANATEAAVESLAPRPRVAIRLLRSKELSAAWAVVLDNATGVVRRGFHASTSSGNARTDWTLPLLTAIEPPHVFAELPGFRDPRFGLPEGLYEIGDAVKLRCHVDEVVPGRRPVLAGWAALDQVTAEAEDAVVLVASQDGHEVRWAGTRQRRADLVGGSRETIRRRAWAGWAVACDLADLGSPGRWSLAVEVTHRGLVRRARIGKSVGELAAAAIGRQVSDRPVTRLAGGSGGWTLRIG